MTLIRNLIVLLVLFVAGTAHAEQLTAGILALEGDGVDKQLTQTLSSIVRNEAQQIEKYQVVNKYDINLSDVLLVLNCSSESQSCMRQVAEQVKARVLIYGTVSKKGGSYQIALTLFDSETGRTINKLNRTISDTDDPVVAFRKEIEAFFAREKGEAVTRVQIGSSIADARIFMEETFVGTVPLERKGLPAGTYNIRVEHPDYEPWVHLLELRQGGDVNLWADLKPKSTSQIVLNPTTETKEVVQDPILRVEEPPVTSGVNWGAWSAVGVGGLALIGSGVFAVMMGDVEQSIADETRAGTITERRYNELVDQGDSYELTHRILLGVGAASVVGGVTWLLLSPEGSSSASLSVTGTQVVGTLKW